jgi:SHS2 domain-containing protein
MHEWREHTAEVELVVDAASEEAVFEEAAVALGELVGGGPGARETRTIAVTGGDRGALLVDWLEELIYLADTAGFTARGARVRLDGEALTATVDGTLGPVDPLVKAATYHGLSFAHEDGRWRAHVVLDV